jgi:hypothetical protein
MLNNSVGLFGIVFIAATCPLISIPHTSLLHFLHRTCSCDFRRCDFRRRCMIDQLFEVSRVTAAVIVLFVHDILLRSSSCFRLSVYTLLLQCRNLEIGRDLNRLPRSRSAALCVLGTSTASEKELSLPDSLTKCTTLATPFAHASQGWPVMSSTLVAMMD